MLIIITVAARGCAHVAFEIYKRGTRRRLPNKQAPRSRVQHARDVTNE